MSPGKLCRGSVRLQEVPAAAAREGDARAGPLLPARGVSSSSSGQALTGFTNPEASIRAAGLGPGHAQPFLLLFQVQQ